MIKNKIPKVLASIMLMCFLLVGVPFANISLPQEKYREIMNYTGVIEGRVTITLNHKAGKKDPIETYCEWYGTCENIYSNSQGTWILTAYHCVEYQSVLKFLIMVEGIRNPDYKYSGKYKLEYQIRYRGSSIIYKNVNILCGDEQKDVAVMFLEELKDQKFCSISLPKMEVGEELFVCACMINDPIVKVITFGEIVNMDYITLDKGWEDQIVYSSITQPGYSGGGIYNKNGNLIGIVHGAITKSAGGAISIATSSKTILEFLLLNKDKVPYVIAN